LTIITVLRKYLKMLKLELLKLKKKWLKHKSYRSRIKIVIYCHKIIKKFRIKLMNLTGQILIKGLIKKWKIFNLLLQILIKMIKLN
jgi:hypothetical protein